MNIIDKLIGRIIKTKNPSVIGLDPDISKIPKCYFEDIQVSFSGVANAILTCNCDLIDTIAPFVPAVKPQMAFYEAYGYHGVCAFEQTVAYAKAKGLIVIEDAKRNDIGNTAQAYADGHLGKVKMPDGNTLTSYDVDFLTVTPFLGTESLLPFFRACKEHDKGVFVLVKTSNLSAGEVQDCHCKDGRTVSELIAATVNKYAQNSVGVYGYSPIGAVVGATWPGDAQKLRGQMPNSYFLVPGYGAQGGRATDVLPCFDDRGLGAIVNSSRGILYAHMTDHERTTCTRAEYRSSVLNAVRQMQKELYDTLKCNKRNMTY